MIAFGSRSTAQTTRRLLQTPSGLTYYKAEWMDSGADPELSPTIFLVEQPPNSTVEPHFHRQNQFQLFVGGGGQLGPSELGPVAVHYAGAYTGYGPIVAGPGGIQYFTIRPVHDSGALFLGDSESRAQMIRGPKRHATSAPSQLLPPQTRASLKDTESVEMIPLAEDGLGARLLRLPPGAPALTAFPVAARGIFAIVLAGSLTHAGGQLAEWESVFVSSQAEMPKLAGGPSGAEVVFLFTPAKAGAYVARRSE